MPSKNETLRERWCILRAAGVSARLCRDARTSAAKFSATLADAGGDPQQYPHLLNSFHGKRSNYSMSKNAVDCRRRRAVLKAAGLDWVRTNLWCRTESATQYALRALPAERELPERPGLLRKAGQRFKDAAAAVAVVLLLCVNGWGCAPAPEAPRFYSISREFPADQAEVIRDVVAAWCEASGDCPEESLFSENAHFELVDDLPESARTLRDCPEGATCIVNANEGNGAIRIARNREPGLDVLWRIAAHEWGHLCIDGHRDESALMSAYQDHAGDAVIDDEAVAAWRAGCP